MTSKSLLASALVAISLAAPASAAAKSHASRVAFPMKAADYRKLMDSRIDRVLAAIDKKLDRSGVSSDRKKAIHRTFDDVAKEARSAIDKATADGTVTEDEANKVKPLVMGIRGKLRERLKAEKGGKPSAPADSSGKADSPGKKAKGKDATASKGEKSKGKDAPAKGKDAPAKGSDASPKSNDDSGE